MNLRFKVFPVGADKAPLISVWQERATRDLRLIHHWESQGARAWGIPTGADNDLFVIDLDVDKQTGERIGEASLMALPRYAALMDHANVQTPSGGRHIYMRHFPGARNSQSKIANKVDTRGQGGYVVAPTSQTDGGIYQGSFPDTLPSVPMGLRAMLLHTPPPPKPSNRITPTGEVEELLTYISPDSQYDDWLAVLMALHDRYSGSGEGLALADRWSASGSKYRKGEVAAKWAGFKRTGVSWATIPAMARQGGADLSDIARRW